MDKVRVFANGKEGWASAKMLLQPYGLKPVFEKSQRDADVFLSPSGCFIKGMEVSEKTRNYSVMVNCFSRKPKSSLKLYSLLVRTGLRVPSFLKGIRARKPLPIHFDEAAAIRTDFAKALEKLRVAKPARLKPGVVFTHDVDSLDSFEKIPDVLEIEKSLGVKSVWFVVARISGEFFKRFPSLRKSSYSHGLRHDGTLVSSAKITVEKTDVAVWNEGFRAPWLHHSTFLFERLALRGVKFDSSIPNYEDITPFFPPGGCGEFIPFQLLNQDFEELGITEYPVTMFQDYALYNRYDCTYGQALDYWKKRADFLVQNGGLVNVLTHPDLKDSGSQEGLENYAKLIKHLKKHSKFWKPGFQT